VFVKYVLKTVENRGKTTIVPAIRSRRWWKSQRSQHRLAFRSRTAATRNSEYPYDCLQNLTQNVGMRCFSARLIPRHLTVEQNENRLNLQIFCNMLKRTRT